MELTVDQALQEGVAAHTEGKLHDAERFYRAILQVQPNHPDANHNLGVLAVAVGKPLEAIPLLKLALEANLKIEQFWLSYIDALIRTEKVDDAKQALAGAEQAGVTVEKLQIFEEQLQPELSPRINISQQELNSPLHEYQYELSAAIELREVGKYKEAREWLYTFLQHTPANAEALSLLSQVLLLDKEEAEAERVLTEVASINSELPSVYRNQARLLLKQSKAAEALEKAQLSCGQSPKDSESLLVLAACLRANQRDLEALPIIEKLLKAFPKYAEAYANRALIKLRAKDTVGAIEDAKTTVSLKPHLTEMWQFLSSLCYQGNDLIAAIEALKNAHKNEPENTVVMTQLGEFLRQDNKVSEAINILKQATKLAPEDASAWTNLGAALQQEKKISDAKVSYERALALNPKSAAIASNLGAIASETEDWESAIRFFEKALEIEPDLAEVHSNLGVTLKKLGRLEEAEACYKQAIALKPEDAEAYNKLSNILIALEKLSEAEESLKKAISLQTNFVDAHYSLGALLQVLGRLKEAELSYQQVIVLRPDHADAHNNLGSIFKDLNRLDEAEASFRKAIALQPSSAEALKNLGALARVRGRLRDSEESYVRAINLEPDFAEAHNGLGRTFQELGRYSEAELSLTRAIALKPDSADAHNNMGNLLQEVGRLEDAEASYAQVIAIQPNLAAAHYNLGNTIKELGRLDEAEPCYQKAVALQPESMPLHNELLKCLYRLDKPQDFYDALDRLVHQGKANSVIGSLICRAALKYGRETPNPFCEEPLRYVEHADLSTQYDFQTIFVDEALTILNRTKPTGRREKFLINGHQTPGNLFEVEHTVTREIQRIIRLEIEKYRDKFKASKEGFLQKWPHDYSLYGWLISMKSGGELKPHIHDQGWLSGTIYINIPPNLDPNSGNLVVSLGENSDSTASRSNIKKHVNVLTGSLVLFPASISHSTIPFHSDEQRIGLTFDVIPEKS
ncbi:tetratricopeptide repeat protein [bacterium]|nr:tetratricopeptide repeat protein [bacterium]